MSEFDIDGFLENLEKDKLQVRDKSTKLNRVLMNTKPNQGLLNMLPVRMRDTGKFYLKIPSVYEYYGDTTKLSSGEAWYRIMPLDAYGELTQEEQDLWAEVRGYLDTLQEKEQGFVENYGQFRIRSYAMFTGIMKSLKDTDGNYNDEFVGYPCLFVYPVVTVINAFSNAINNKIDAMQGRKEWIPYVLNPNPSGYKGIMQIDFRPRSNGQVGYDCTVSFEFNSELNMVVDPEYEIPEDTLKLFENAFATFVGWSWNRDENRPFDPVVFKELRDQLKMRVQALSISEPSKNEESYENKNNLNTGGHSEDSAPKKISPFG